MGNCFGKFPNPCSQLWPNLSLMNGFLLKRNEIYQKTMNNMIYEFDMNMKKEEVSVKKEEDLIKREKENKNFSLKRENNT